MKEYQVYYNISLSNVMKPEFIYHLLRFCKACLQTDSFSLMLEKIANSQ